MSDRSAHPFSRPGLANGRVWHYRRGPGIHRFAYRQTMTLLDLDGLRETFCQSRMWTMSRPGLVRFYRPDYMDPSVPDLAEAARARVEDKVGFRPDGPVYWLGHLRQWGMCFNPVSFYFLQSRDRRQLQFILAEIHNTPWGERHVHVLDCRDQAGPEYRFVFAKEFHVSPFLPMDLAYDWRFRLAEERLDVHMEVMDGDAVLFSAGLGLDIEPLTPRLMTAMPFKYPFMTLRVVAAIYWQAMCLWWKKTPFYAHPEKTGKVTTGLEKER